MRGGAAPHGRHRSGAAPPGGQEMIRINLLPRRKRPAAQGPSVTLQGRRARAPVAVLVAAALLVMVGTAMSQQRAAERAREVDRAGGRRSRARSRRRSRGSTGSAQERAELDLRLRHHQQAREGPHPERAPDGRTRAVRARLPVADRVDQDGANSVSIEGITFSNLVVSDFMSRLERSPMFANIELDVAERGKQDERDVVKFRVTCQRHAGRAGEQRGAATMANIDLKNAGGAEDRPSACWSPAGCSGCSSSRTSCRSATRTARSASTRSRRTTRRSPPSWRVRGPRSADLPRFEAEYEQLHERWSWPPSCCRPTASWRRCCARSRSPGSRPA